MTKSIREQLIELGLAGASSASKSGRLRQEGKGSREEVRKESAEVRQVCETDVTNRRLTQSRSFGAGASTLREQLIAEGRIKPVDSFLARAEELRKKAIAAGENRRSGADGLRAAGKSGKDAQAEKRDSKSRAKPTMAPKAERKAKRKAEKNLSDGLSHRGKKFKCSICGNWIPLGEGLKHEAMHKGIDYVPTSDIRPREVGCNSETQSNTWVHVYQGGLPGLGKRH